MSGESRREKILYMIDIMMRYLHKTYKEYTDDTLTTEYCFCPSLSGGVEYA